MVYNGMNTKKQKSLISIILFIVLLHNINVFAQNRDNIMTSKTLRSMARACIVAGKYEDACRYAQKALAEAANQKSNESETALCYLDLATVYSYQEMLDQSAQMFTKGIELQKQALGADHPYIAHSLRMLCEVHLKQGDLHQAQILLDEAQSIILNYCKKDSQEFAPFIHTSARLLAAGADYDKARMVLENVLHQYETAYGDRHLMTALVLQDLAKLHIQQGDLDIADNYISKSLSIQTHIYGRAHPELIDAWLLKADICTKMQQSAQSEYYIAKAVGTAEQYNNAVRSARLFEHIHRIRQPEPLVSAGL